MEKKNDEKHANSNKIQEEFNQALFQQMNELFKKWHKEITSKEGDSPNIKTTQDNKITPEKEDPDSISTSSPTVNTQK